MTVTVIDVDATTRNGRDAVREIVREIAEDHAYDPYGSGMLALEAVTDALYVMGDGVPSAITQFPMGYRAGENGQYIAGRVDSEKFTSDDVRYFMFVLSRYIDVVRLAGRNY